MLSIRALILWAAAAAFASGTLATESVPAGAAPAGAPAPTGPDCAPATSNNSAILGGSVTVSPLPGSRDADSSTQISFLGVPARALSVLSVIGSSSGPHGGRLLPYSQGDGASFLPGRPFTEGERVTVRARLRAHGRASTISDTFAVARQDAISSTPETVHPGSAAQVQSFQSRPDLHPPVIAVTASAPARPAGEEFVAPYGGPGQAGPMILDQNGGLVWFKPLPSHVSAGNFAVQEYEGRPALTWWQGNISVHGFGLGTDVVLDGSYTKVAQVKAGNGLMADLHDFQLTGRGTALITAYDPILCNVSAAGGAAYGAVTDGVLQEIDVRTGLVRMQWTSLDHVALGESYESAARSSLAFPYDYFHLNSIDIDPDGSVLLSARNTWAAYDVDPRSGRILWRLGGRRSSFREGSGTRTAWQHDPRALGNGTFSIFDNGSAPTVHGQSRGIVLRLDPGSRTATLVSQLRHAPPLIAESQGNLQALPGGGWFVGWGQVPDFSEFGAEGQLLFDAHFPAHDQSYRSFSFEWTGTPAHRPAVALAAGPSGATLFASWNGATLVRAWRALAGPTPTALAPAAEVPRSGFETAIALPPAATGPYFAVEALDASGRSLGVSAAVR